MDYRMSDSNPIACCAHLIYRDVASILDAEGGV